MNNRKILYWSVIVALAGFLFGFNNKQLQQFWGSSDLFHGLIVMSSALCGTVIWVYFKIPETKGRTLEELSGSLSNNE